MIACAIRVIAPIVRGGADRGVERRVLREAGPPPPRSSRASGPRGSASISWTSSGVARARREGRDRRLEARARASKSSPIASRL